MGHVAPLDPAQYRELVRRALEEDLGAAGDITTAATVPPTVRARGVWMAKASCVLAGLDVAHEVFRQLEPGVQIIARRQDGDVCAPGDELGAVVGRADTLLVGERTALNFLQRLSGVATLARRFVDASGGQVSVLDTRKTTPMLRALEKYAVRVGGARNHRVGLYDAILIKDNHIRLAGGVTEAIARVRRARPGMPVEIEAQSLAQVDDALAAGADVVLADNLSLADVKETVRRARGLARVEVSGGVTLDRMPDLAATGADSVSIGALTHSAPAVDISFEIEPL